MSLSNEQLGQTLPGRLFLHARVRGDAVALREKDLGLWREITWRRYAARTAAVARKLWSMGVRPGDHVAILSDNRPGWLYADLGAQLIGARSVGVYQTNPPEDVAYILTHSGARVLFCEDQEQVDKAVDVRAQTPEVEHVVVFDPRGIRAIEDDRLVTWADFVADGERMMDGDSDWVDTRLMDLDPDAPSMVVYTSGTTGQPKGAMLSSRNALSSCVEINRIIKADESDCLLSYLPLCHVAEKIFSLFVPLTTGAVVHFGESIATVRRDLCEVSPTVFLGVPRIWEKMAAGVTLRMQDSSWLKRTLYRLCSRLGQDIGARRLAGEARLTDPLVWFVCDMLVFRALQERLGLRRCRIPVTGAAPVGEDLLRWFHSIGVLIHEGYGQTECAGVSHISPLGSPRMGTVGQVLPGSECRIAEDGEILVRGPGVFCGYLHDPEATARTVADDGWLHTGDIGAVDDDGFLRITGRKKEIIITAGGKNLSPEKIENALKSSPYIREVVAVGDRRKFIGAMVQIDGDAVGDWATRLEIPYTDYADLTRRPEVLKLVDAEVRQANDRLARVEQVRGFRLFDRELQQDDGELTATQKVRRRAIMEIWAPQIEEIYGKRSGVSDSSSPEEEGSPS